MKPLWAYPSKPRAGQAARPGGAKAAGLLLEVQVEDLLRESGLRYKRGPWIKYGEWGVPPRHCQPDFVVWARDGKVSVVECKLSLYKGAISQVKSLYLPVVECWLGLPTGGIIVVGEVPTLDRLTSAVYFGVPGEVKILRPTPRQVPSTTTLPTPGVLP